MPIPPTPTFAPFVAVSRQSTDATSSQPDSGDIVASLVAYSLRSSSAKECDGRTRSTASTMALLERDMDMFLAILTPHFATTSGSVRMR